MKKTEVECLFEHLNKIFSVRGADKPLAILHTYIERIVNNLCELVNEDSCNCV